MGSGLGGLNKAPDGMVIGLVQIHNPVVVTPEDLARQTDRICGLVAKARRNLATMDLVVFPEYALHGLSMDTNPAIMCRLDGPEVEKFRSACIANDIWGCFSIMELNLHGNPFNSGLIIDNKGEIKLYYRKMHPWVPVEPWEPGDLGIPVCDGPNGAKIALIICHDGMFPEMAREAAYKGANVMLRTAGYTAPIRQSWHFTNQSNAFCNLMYTASVCLAGSDGSFNSMGEGMIVNYDGTPLATGNGIPDEIITGEVRPRQCDEARLHWGVENNIYQLGHRGYVAVKGGARDCPYTYMRDLAAGTYALPWEKDVKVTDGTSCGFPAPTRSFKPVPTTLPPGKLAAEVIIRNATLPDGTRHDIGIKDGRIAALLLPSRAEPAVVVMPALVDGHIHLDKTLLGLPWVPNQATGNRVADRIEAERKVRAAHRSEQQTGANLVREVMASGTLHMRSHVDIDNQLGLANLHEILKVREQFRDLVTIQIVAFPQSGILRSPGTAALLDAAVAEGADLVGGLDPVGIDGDLDGHLDPIFAIAERRGVGLDIHLHDGGEGGIAQLTAIAERTVAAGLQGKVAVSHAFALGSVPADSAARTADLLATAGVAIMSHGPGGAAIPPLKLLHEHGVEVFGGSDNIRDAWSPFGNGDMLERAMLIGYRANFRHDDELAFAFDMVTAAAARVLGVAPYGIALGAPADLVVVEAGSLAEAVATRPRRKLVIKAGRVIAKDGVLVP